MTAFGSKQAKEILEGVRLVATGDKSTNYSKLKMSQEEYSKIYPLINNIVLYTQKGEGIGSGIHYTSSQTFTTPDVTKIVFICSGGSDGAGWRYWYVTNFKDGTSYTSPMYGRWYHSSDGWF